MSGPGDLSSFRCMTSLSNSHIVSPRMYCRNWIPDWQYGVAPNRRGLKWYMLYLPCNPEVKNFFGICAGWATTMKWMGSAMLESEGRICTHTANTLWLFAFTDSGCCCCCWWWLLLLIADILTHRPTLKGQGQPKKKKTINWHWKSKDKSRTWAVKDPAFKIWLDFGFFMLVKA